MLSKIPNLLTYTTVTPLLVPLLLSGCTTSETSSTSATSTSDTSSCTDLGCGLQDGSNWVFNERDAQWVAEQGMTYVFTVSFDDIVITCSGVLGENISCDDPSLSVETTRTGQGDSTYDSVSGLQLSVFPGTTQLKIERDGTVVFDDEFNLVATERFPNGEACGPVCTLWIETVTW